MVLWHRPREIQDGVPFLDRYTNSCLDFMHKMTGIYTYSLPFYFYINQQHTQVATVSRIWTPFPSVSTLTQLLVRFCLCVLCGLDERATDSGLWMMYVGYNIDDGLCSKTVTRLDWQSCNHAVTELRRADRILYESLGVMCLSNCVVESRCPPPSSTFHLWKSFQFNSLAVLVFTQPRTA